MSVPFEYFPGEAEYLRKTEGKGQEFYPGPDHEDPQGCHDALCEYAKGEEPNLQESLEAIGRTEPAVYNEETEQWE